MPGCVEFGVRVFSECCALESVGNIVDGGSHLAIGAIVSQYAFEECAKLARLSLPHVRCSSLEVLKASTSELLLAVRSYANSSEWARKELGGGLMWSATLLRCVPN